MFKKTAELQASQNKTAYDSTIHTLKKSQVIYYHHLTKRETMFLIGIKSNKRLN